MKRQAVTVKQVREENRQAYAVMEAMRLPLEGAEAVLSLLMNSQERGEGTEMPNLDPQTLWHALNLVRGHVRAARTAATIKGDSLTRTAAAIGGRRVP